MQPVKETYMPYNKVCMEESLSFAALNSKLAGAAIVLFVQLQNNILRGVGLVLLVAVEGL